MSGGFLSLPLAEGICHKRARFLFRVRSEKARPDDDQLAATQSHGVLSQKRYMDITGNRVVAALAGTENFNHVEPDDFVISLRTFEGGIERATESGCISPAYTVLAPSREVNPRYYQHLLKSQVFISHLQTTVTGIRDGKSVKFENFANIVLPAPDLETQRQIAEFLDHETARIDLLIEKKQRLMALLGERNNAARSECLRQLRESYGEIKLSHVCLIQRGRFNYRPRNAEELFDGEFPFLQTGDVAQAKKFISEHKQTLSELGASISKSFKRGTVLMAIAANVGNVAILDFDAFCPDSVVGFVPEKRLDAEFLYYALKGAGEQIATSSTSNAQDNTNIARLGALRISLPKKEIQLSTVAMFAREEQHEIRIAAKANISIDRLKEYRSALITAAVTGQIDVKAATRSGAAERRLDALQEEIER